ncbi:hypothetical protein COCSUDRAFT_33362 [Coccomyxa subellipsoidea C-169]|uniref:Uncharacterized protein n=1 Tax=Coccomyxa subellipsoidea (strain C-169) TaxID=574566 RepID=I0YWB2_COCSC|nr:hypothetical protein COCSUDRAFT_33362 [Coccomyxa subellipsoidea C-169]EIE22681.1 hypothetical protein COCSUDRAFT_33362 [Coccomyxa subellipsoidea C-169]|eukprot:XP_005647225.1 hypothetical protein COCSUDRAFT_33362 [Coccomyxa subellipsoidea C-169]
MTRWAVSQIDEMGRLSSGGHSLRHSAPLILVSVLLSSNSRNPIISILFAKAR